MSFFHDIHVKKLSENESQLQFWENYLHNLKALNFNEFSEKLKVPALIPIGNRILFRGELIHTNEVTVALGADYFVKCSIKQAEVLRQHKITDAEIKLIQVKKEREYLEKQFTFSNENVFYNEGQEIIEPYNEEEDKLWREHHREKIRKHKLSNKGLHSQNSDQTNMTDEHLWYRLEELELQEELDNQECDDPNVNIEFQTLPKMNSQLAENKLPIYSYKTDQTKPVKENCNELIKNKSGSPLNILQQAIDKQMVLEEKLMELKNKSMTNSKTEYELISKIEELEVLDELEDEINRLDGVLCDEIEESINLEENYNISNIRKSVSFANDNDDSVTLELTFVHSENLPDNNKYDPSKGIVKPSDVYDAYPELFKDTKETVSILKESKYPLSNHIPNEINHEEDEVLYNKNEDYNARNEITINDASENVVPFTDETKVEPQKRQLSLFKQRRMQKNKQ